MEYAIHLFNAGGVVMYPLVLFMLAACTIYLSGFVCTAALTLKFNNCRLALNQAVMQMIGLHQNKLSRNNDDALSQFVTPIVDSVYNFEGLENRLHDVVGLYGRTFKTWP